MKIQRNRLYQALLTSPFQPKPRFISKMAISLLLLSGAAHTTAQENGALIGQVVGSASKKLQGAIISIESVNRRAVTDAEGRFRIQDLPDGSYQVNVDYIGYNTLEISVEVRGGQIVAQDIRLSPADDNLEIIEVVGSRAAIVSALNQERSSDTLKNVVASTDAGKFADQNIAEALQRLPGISIERSDGEGRFVSVRGLGPNFTNVRLNGARVPSTETAPDRDRAVALDVVPAELLENLEVSKVVTAAEDGDTIGGTVSIRSLSAFQREGQHISFKGELGYDERSTEDAYKGSFIYSNKFADDTVGIALSLSTSERDYLIENIEGDEGDGILEGDNDSGIETLGRLDTRTLDLGRERSSVSLNFDYRPTDSAQYHLRYTLSNLLETELRTRNSFDYGRGDINPVAPNSGTAEEMRIRKEYRDQDEEQDIETFSIGGKNFFDRWTIDYNLSYSEATRDEDDFRVRFSTSDDIGENIGSGVSYTIGEDSYRIEGIDQADSDLIADRSNYEFNRYRITLEDSKDENTEFALNFERDMDFGSLQFGFKYFEHAKELDISNSVFEEAQGEADATLADFRAFSPDFDIGDWGPSTPLTEVISFYRSQFALGNVSAEEGDLLDNQRDELLSDYDSEEEITAAYGMGRFNFGDNMTLIAGVRVEQTDFSTSGFVVNTGDFAGNVADPVDFDKDYTDVLPSANLRWNIRDDLIFRAGYYNSVVRPSFARNNPGIDIDFDEDDNELQIDAGNPDLDPFSAMNLDLNLAWYPENVVAVVQAGIFYKDIDDFIFRANVDADSGVGRQIIQRAQLADVVATADDVEIRTTLNGEAAEVVGLELSYFQELPAGFNIGANMTFVDSEAELETRDAPLIGQADETANLTAGWARQKWDIRLTAAYTSDFLVRLNDEDDVNNDVYTDSRLQFDVGLKYQLSDDIQLYFDAINLTREQELNEFRSNGSGFVQQYQNIERTFLLGVRGKFN